MLNSKWLIFSIIAILASCKDDPAPTYRKMDLYGQWESIEIERYNSDPDCLPQQENDLLIIYPYMLTWFVSVISNCEPKEFKSGMTIEYTYDDINTITTEIKQTYKIVQLGGGTMKIEKGSSSGTYGTFTYQKVCEPVGALCSNGTIVNEMNVDICGRAGVARWTCK